MPAIQVSRLKAEVQRLMELIDRPPLFLRALHELLDFYDDRTYRPGQVQNIQSLLPHYRVPRPVIHQIEVELAHALAGHSQLSWTLAEALWRDTYLEPRLLAIYLLGLAPIDPPAPVIERLLAWAQPAEDPQIIHELIIHGAGALLKVHPEDWAALTGQWLADENPSKQGIGLQALLTLAEDEHFDNVPMIFQLISPLMQKVPVNFQSDLLVILKVMDKRSPAEAAYFFKQILTLSRDPRLPRLIRHCLADFDAEMQSGLRQALKTWGSSSVNYPE